MGSSMSPNLDPVPSPVELSIPSDRLHPLSSLNALSGKNIVADPRRNNSLQSQSWSREWPWPEAAACSVPLTWVMNGWRRRSAHLGRSSASRRRHCETGRRRHPPCRSFLTPKPNTLPMALIQKKMMFLGVRQGCPGRPWGGGRPTHHTPTHHP